MVELLGPGRSQVAVATGPVPATRSTEVQAVGAPAEEKATVPVGGAVAPGAVLVTVAVRVSSPAVVTSGPTASVVEVAAAVTVKVVEPVLLAYVPPA